MASASFNDGNRGLQIGSNTGCVTADLHSSLHHNFEETGNIITFEGGHKFEGSVTAGGNVHIHTTNYNHTSPIADASAEYKRARESSSEKTSSCSDKPRDKRARLDDDDNSDSSYGSYGIDWDKIPRQKSPLIASGPSQPTWNDEAHTSPRDSAMNGVTQGDSGVSSSGNSPENDSDNGLNNEGVEFWDNNSDDSEEEQLLDSSDSSEEDSE